MAPEDWKPLGVTFVWGCNSKAKHGAHIDDLFGPGFAGLVTDLIRCRLLTVAKLNMWDALGWISFYWAASRCRKVQPRDMLLAGADPDARDLFDLTPVHYTCLVNGRTNYWRLVRHGANIDMPECGTRPPHCAIIGSYTGMAELLLREGAGTEANGALRKSLLHWAAL
jgi:ankyrin repeat protein